jgi:hypothetical protein
MARRPSWPEGDHSVSSFVACFFINIASSSIGPQDTTRASMIKRLFIFLFFFMLGVFVVLSYFSAFVNLDRIWLYLY